jgi:hypothetical protein
VTHDVAADLAGAATAAALLTAEHLLMYDRRDTYHPLARYTAGVAALGIGHTVACALSGDARAALRLWLVVAAGGGSVLALYAARGELPGQERFEREARDAIDDVRAYVRRAWGG